jgi:hypothetical protein
MTITGHHKSAVKSFKVAVRQAVRAFERSGQTVDAALAYAATGFPVFPLDPVSKRPLPARDRDPTGTFKDGIPGTGGHLKATMDEEHSQMVATAAMGADWHADG